jgi:predicted PurR-regulated permease PerM
MSKPTRISYGFMFLLMVLVGWLHLATPFITLLFASFALNKLDHGRTKWTAVGLFLIVMLLASYLLVFFLNQAYVALPKIAGTTIPIVLDLAEQQGFEMPFSDYASLKAMAMENIKVESARVGHLVRFATVEFAELIIGLVVAVSMFLNSKFDLRHEQHIAKNNLYSLTGAEIAERVRTFYDSFTTVMGAQVVISAINTSLTAIFVFAVGLPNASIIIALTFICGLLPIIGNLVSNTLIIGVALTVSPTLALGSLAFLVVVHKLEYFLNSKIVGDRIKNPMWLTLLGLVIGEKLMGLPGMILAPVVLHYIKVEASNSKVTTEPASETTLP